MSAIYDLVPYSFIDEAFHVPQAVKYCNGTFHEWDPKITTLPGLYLILRRLKMNQKGYSRRMVLWHAFNLAIFPVAYFFTFLYYTDTLSTCTVLLMLDLHLSSKKNLASLVGILSCIARQVNIVWVGYLLLYSFSKSVHDYLTEPAMRNTMKQLRKK
ncbi:hypothetical protein GE061_004670, partial [Apolygus lucorum]